MVEISFYDLFKLNNPYIIDIRSVEKYNDNHIPNSINIYYNLLLSNPSKFLNKNTTYYIYCQRGITSKKVSELLRIYGYDVISIIGGWEQYILNK